MGLYFKISPELSDGEHWTFIEANDKVDVEILIDSIKEWFANGPLVGYSFAVELVELTDEEIEEIQEI